MYGFWCFPLQEMRNFDGPIFFIINKAYKHAKLAQWGTGDRDIGTYKVCLLSSSKEFHEVKSKKARDFSSFSLNQFKTVISTINWIDITGNFGTNVNRAFSTFCKKLNKIVNKFAPIRELSNQKLKQLSKPWITKGIRHSIKINFLLRKIKLGTKYIETN